MVRVIDEHGVSKHFTLILEAGFKPFQWRPGFFKSPSMYRVWWLCFAFGILRVPFKTFAETSYVWMEKSDYY